MRSTWATRARLRTSCWAARQMSDDLPNRRGANSTTSCPASASAFSSASSRSRSAKASSRASAPNRNGLGGWSEGTALHCTSPYNDCYMTQHHMTYADPHKQPYADLRYATLRKDLAELAT